MALVSRLVHLAKQAAFEREAYQGKRSSQTQVIADGIPVSTEPHDVHHTKKRTSGMIIVGEMMQSDRQANGREERAS
jgi:hypothetical protein